MLATNPQQASHVRPGLGHYQSPATGSHDGSCHLDRAALNTAMTQCWEDLQNGGARR
jgi:hypothetical protein